MKIKEIEFDKNRDHAPLMLVLKISGEKFHIVLLTFYI